MKKLLILFLISIEGLDPALPLFSEIGAKPEYTLDSTDADFVDVIHTNVGWKGQFGPEGHADFYITNGYAQPGCVASMSVRISKSYI